MEDQLLGFFKTFTDIQRLRMAALLSEGAFSVDEIAARLNMKISDVPHQLEMLEKLDLITTSADRRVSLNVKALEALSRGVLSGRRPEAEARSNDENADDFDRMTVKKYSLPDGRLRELPLKEKTLLPILRHVVQVIEPGEHYTEKQINAKLAQFHADTAALRRYLYDYKLIDRAKDGSTYWRRETEA